MPKDCADAAAAACRVHIVLHGCKQNSGAIGRTLVDKVGFNAWADTNRIIVLYPQTTAITTSTTLNPNACWDWWGYTGAGWDDKRGIQLRAIVAMVNRLKLPSP